MPLTQVNPGLLDTQAQYTGFKNRLINGAMGIWQRGTSSSSGAANAYLADRFLLANWTSASQSSDVPSNQGFQYSIEFTNSSPTYPLIGQRIESSNCRDLAGQTVTVSYWAKNVSGSAILYSEIYIANSADNFSSLTYVGVVQATATNPSSSWTYYSGSITLPAGAANGIQLNIVRNNASVAVTRVTGVQLEKGSTATSFDYRPYGTELALCQRYFEKSYDIDVVPATSNNNAGANTTLTLQFGVSWDVKYKATKRAAATVTTYSPFNGATGNFSVNMGSNAAVTGVLSNGLSGFSPYTGTSPGNVVNYIHWTASAEL